MDSDVFSAMPCPGDSRFEFSNLIQLNDNVSRILLYYQSFNNLFLCLEIDMYVLRNTRPNDVQHNM